MGNGEKSYRRYLAGDREGLAEIVREYSDGLIFFIDSFVKNITISEEIMEEVFVELALKKPKFSGKSTFKTWLYSIARYTAMDYLKKLRRFSETPPDEMYDLSDEADLEKEYIREEQRIQLHRAISKLNSDHSQILYLIYFEGFTNPEAARIMKKSDRQIRNLLYRAKLALRSQLEKEGFVYEEL